MTPIQRILRARIWTIVARAVNAAPTTGAYDSTPEITEAVDALLALTAPLLKALCKHGGQLTERALYRFGFPFRVEYRFHGMLIWSGRLFPPGFYWLEVIREVRRVLAYEGIDPNLNFLLAEEIWNKRVKEVVNYAD